MSSLSFHGGTDCLSRLSHGAGVTCIMPLCILLPAVVRVNIKIMVDTAAYELCDSKKLLYNTDC